MSIDVQRDDTEPLRPQPDRTQLPGSSPPPAAASDSSAETQLAFAQATFANVQELNRTMDQKANYVLASVALLTAALGLVASRAVTVTVDEDWQRILRGSAILLILLYLLVAFAVIFLATSIYEARSQRASVSTAAPGMLFPLMLLERYVGAGRRDETAYLAKLRTLEIDDVLQDYSHQIVEVSIIYEAKQKQVNMCLRLFRWTGVLWLLTMLMVVMVIVLIA